MCTDCHWCWTISITGKVYVESRWPLPALDAGGDDDFSHRARRLLRSIDGLADKLATPWSLRPEVGHPGPANGGLTAEELGRLKITRAAIEADYFNEGMPRAQLRAEGVPLPPLEDEDPRT